MDTTGENDMVQYDTPIVVNDASFDRVVLHPPFPIALPVIAVFWSPREIPRQRLNDVLEQTARDYAGEVLVVKLDVDDAPQTRNRYQVTTLPQFLFFRQGELVARAKGLPTAEMLRPWAEYLLGRGPKPASSPPKRKREKTGQVLSVNDADFDEMVLGASLPAVVDFWAEWCGPCRMVAPIMDQMAQEFAGRVIIASLNVDSNPQVAQRYGIRSIPTLLFFRNGQVVDRVVGAQPAAVLRQKINALTRL